MSFYIQTLVSQNYPSFGPEIKVTITGLTFDAMEPFISPDGNTLFFNSLNSGGNTNLYYATKVNDSSFTYVGLLGGTYDPTPNHLDAVASHDTSNNFFWTSLRGYPTPMENLHRGIYANGSVSNITRVYGNFNIPLLNYPFGWIIMDASINYQGNLLYYCNAKFDFSNTTCVNIPCESKLGVAQKVNDSTFSKLVISNAIFSKVNDTVNYILYAPQVTKDGLELYYTRLLKGSFNTEICISVRTNLADTFSLPLVIHSNLSYAPEAASPSSDKQKIYYHQKDGSALHRIYLRYRTTITGIEEQKDLNPFKVFPNPCKNIINIDLPEAREPYTIQILSFSGQELYKTSGNTKIDVSNLAKGMYFMVLKQNNKVLSKKLIKE